MVWLFIVLFYVSKRRRKGGIIILSTYNFRRRVTKAAGRSVFFYFDHSGMTRFELGLEYAQTCSFSSERKKDKEGEMLIIFLLFLSSFSFYCLKILNPIFFQFVDISFQDSHSCKYVFFRYKITIVQRIILIKENSKRTKWTNTAIKSSFIIRLYP